MTQAQFEYINLFNLHQTARFLRPFNKYLLAFILIITLLYDEM